MSFEDLQKLKERLGSKVYNETLFGKKKVVKREFKRANKNRPREMSAKIPVSRLREIVKIKKAVNRDPRFDSLCGTFDEKAFKRSYGFISKFRENDLNNLKKELKQTTDPKIIKKMKYLIQRLENQLREEQIQKKKEEKIQQEKKEMLASIKRGEKPVFKKKCKLESLFLFSLIYLLSLILFNLFFLAEKKILDLISQYEELKESGKIKKHIKRLRKKNICKDRVKLNMDEIE